METNDRRNVLDLLEKIYLQEAFTEDIRQLISGFAIKDDCLEIPCKNEMDAKRKIMEDYSMIAQEIIKNADYCNVRLLRFHWVEDGCQVASTIPLRRAQVPAA